MVSRLLKGAFQSRPPLPRYVSTRKGISTDHSMHIPIEGVSIGQHPLVSRLLKGAFQSRPPLPRYQGTWDVSVVLHHIGGHQLDQSLSLKELSLRTVMLLALTRPSRSADISKLNLKDTPEGAVFTPAALAKQSRPGRKTFSSQGSPRMNDFVQ